CSLDTCNLATNECSYGPGPNGCANTGDCDDGLACTLEACVDYCCVQKDLCCDTDLDCDDGDGCTTDTCVDSSCAHSPLFTAACCKTTVTSWHFDDPFEDQWVFENSVAPGLGWQVWGESGMAPSSPALLYYGSTELMSYDFGVSAGTATSPAFTLFSNVNAQLKWAMLLEVESNINFDKLAMYVIYDDNKLLAWKKPSTITPGWSNITVNLSAFAGKTLRLQFVFETIDDKGNNGFGVAVDNMEIVSTCAPLTCGKAIDCVDLITETFETCMGGKCIYTAP
ncbi:MAG: hypothetical protein HUU55_18885, partial [Myxococcales bacterium]|nr:hypothetical protein [Myxococcales bacterium]